MILLAGLRQKSDVSSLIWRRFVGFFPLLLASVIMNQRRKLRGKHQLNVAKLTTKKRLEEVRRNPRNVDKLTIKHRAFCLNSSNKITSIIITKRHEPPTQWFKLSFQTVTKSINHNRQFCFSGQN